MRSSATLTSPCISPRTGARANHQFFDQKLAENAFRALAIESKLRQAIRDEAFVLHYQPQQRMDDGAVTGFEALIAGPRRMAPGSSPTSSSPSPRAARSSSRSARGCCARRAGRTARGRTRGCRAFRSR
jgi:hypothetical protein